jgi:hypothetical protein
MAGNQEPLNPGIYLFFVSLWLPIAIKPTKQDNDACVLTITGGNNYGS